MTGVLTTAAIVFLLRNNLSQTVPESPFRSPSPPPSLYFRVNEHQLISPVSAADLCTSVSFASLFLDSRILL